jgi:hypothetical protein
MNPQELFTLFAISQGCLVLGIAVFVFFFYFPKNKVQVKSAIYWHTISMVLSYALLLIATIRTAIMECYSWPSYWYALVTIAYIIGDISIVFIFRKALKKEI